MSTPYLDEFNNKSFEDIALEIPETDVNMVSDYVTTAFAVIILKNVIKKNKDENEEKLKEKFKNKYNIDIDNL